MVDIMSNNNTYKELVFNVVKDVAKNVNTDNKTILGVDDSVIDSLTRVIVNNKIDEIVKYAINNNNASGKLEPIYGSIFNSVDFTESLNVEDNIKRKISGIVENELNIFLSTILKAIKQTVINIENYRWQLKNKNNIADEIDRSFTFVMNADRYYHKLMDEKRYFDKLPGNVDLTRIKLPNTELDIIVDEDMFNGPYTDLNTAIEDEFNYTGHEHILEEIKEIVDLINNNQQQEAYDKILRTPAFEREVIIGLILTLRNYYKHIEDDTEKLLISAYINKAIERYRAIQKMWDTYDRENTLIIGVEQDKSADIAEFVVYILEDVYDKYKNKMDVDNVIKGVVLDKVFGSKLNKVIVKVSIKDILDDNNDKLVYYTNKYKAYKDSIILAKTKETYNKLEGIYMLAFNDLDIDAISELGYTAETFKSALRSILTYKDVRDSMLSDTEKAVNLIFSYLAKPDNVGNDIYTPSLYFIILSSEEDVKNILGDDASAATLLIYSIIVYLTEWFKSQLTVV